MSADWIKITSLLTFTIDAAFNKLTTSISEFHKFLKSYIDCLKNRSLKFTDRSWSLLDTMLIQGRETGSSDHY